MSLIKAVRQKELFLTQFFSSFQSLIDRLAHSHERGSFGLFDLLIQILISSRSTFIDIWPK